MLKKSTEESGLLNVIIQEFGPNYYHKNWNIYYYNFRYILAILDFLALSVVADDLGSY